MQHNSNIEPTLAFGRHFKAGKVHLNSKMEGFFAIVLGAPFLYKEENKIHFFSLIKGKFCFLLAVWTNEQTHKRTHHSNNKTISKKKKFTSELIFPIIHVQITLKSNFNSKIKKKKDFSGGKLKVSFFLWVNKPSWINRPRINYFYLGSSPMNKIYFTE